MIVRLARSDDVGGFLTLAAQVEIWFGPMVDSPGFRAAVSRHIERGMALVVEDGEILGGLLFGAKPPKYHATGWLCPSRLAAAAWADAAGGCDGHVRAHARGRGGGDVRS